MGRLFIATVNCTLALVLLWGRVINSQYMFFGRCLNFPTKANFSLESYLGLWYTIEQYPSISSGISICQTSNYSQPEWVTERYGNSSFRVWISQVSLNGWKSIPGVAILPNVTEPAKYLINVEGIPVMEENPYYILATDYRNYSVVWSCVEHAAFNFQMVWFLSRSQIASPYSRDKAYNSMRKLGINTRILVGHHQRFCSNPRPDPEYYPGDENEYEDEMKS